MRLKTFAGRDFVYIFVVFISVNCVVGKVEERHILHKEVLDPSGKIVVEWRVNFQEKLVTFDVTGETRGYVGFGLSRGGGMADADIVIGGIDSEGSAYFTDYHGVGDMRPVEDESQDWELLAAFENSTHTFIRFQRIFDSCDPHDVAITNDTLNLIWALGESDDIFYHGALRGSSAVNLLDPPYPQLRQGGYKSWEITVDMEMPSKSFSYWCTIHKAPKFNGKNHVIGFRPLLKGDLAKRHTHHFVLYQCTAPPGIKPKHLFGPFTKDGGDECYSAEAMASRPTQLCQTFLYVWGSGGKAFNLPKHVGFPIGETRDEYFMLEIHFDNPNKLSNQRFETGVEVLYTDKLRKHDAGMMTIGHTVLASLMIPPKSKDFMVVGHCSSKCTRKIIPDSGVKIFNVLMHTHLAGRKMKLRHFRKGVELPWIANDDSYHFNFQKNRPLQEERTILPGDHVTFECRYDTSTRSGMTVAGYSTTDEMCETFAWYYPKLTLSSCSSFYPIDKMFEKFGIQNVTWLDGLDVAAQPVITAPPEMANKTFAQALDDKIVWDHDMRAEVQNMITKSDHQVVCSGDDVRNNDGQDSEEVPAKILMTNYPKIKRNYAEPNMCIDK